LVTSGMTGDLLRNIDAATPIIHAGEFRAIGTAFATSLGVKLALPGARVVCVSGDGSFMMEQQELATARLHNIPVLAIVLRNNAYGDLLCHVVMETPVNLTSRQKELLQELEEINERDGGRHNPRAKSWMDRVKEFFAE